jgi:hypothetical protein
MHRRHPAPPPPAASEPCSLKVIYEEYISNCVCFMSNKIKFVPLPLYPPSSRGATELRAVDYRMGLVPEATGSCWYSAGSGAYSTKVCCCVLGPKPVKQVSLTGDVRRCIARHLATQSLQCLLRSLLSATSQPHALVLAESSHAILSCYFKFTGVSGRDSM